MVIGVEVVREGRRVPVYGRGGGVELRTGGNTSGNKTDEGGSKKRQGDI